MTPISLAMPAPIPADLFGTFAPAALFGVWSVLVVAIIVGLCAMLGAETRRDVSAPPIRLAQRGRAEAERNAA
ncbi:MAG TPA: hypothetical protein VKU61_10010 [Candidatus Binatia bacterium]|nr:hypothetical protein [Candidatus Binatia bacterium]